MARRSFVSPSSPEAARTCCRAGRMLPSVHADRRAQRPLLASQRLRDLRRRAKALQNIPTARARLVSPGLTAPSHSSHGFPRLPTASSACKLLYLARPPSAIAGLQDVASVCVSEAFQKPWRPSAAEGLPRPSKASNGFAQFPRPCSKFGQDAPRPAFAFRSGFVVDAVQTPSKAVRGLPSPLTPSKTSKGLPWPPNTFHCCFPMPSKPFPKSCQIFGRLSKRLGRSRRKTNPRRASQNHCRGLHASFQGLGLLHHHPNVVDMGSMPRRTDSS